MADLLNCKGRLVISENNKYKLKNSSFLYGANAGIYIPASHYQRTKITLIYFNQTFLKTRGRNIYSDAYK